MVGYQSSLMQKMNIYTINFSFPPIRFSRPTLIVTCRSTCLERFPDKSVKYAMKSLGKDIQALWVQQAIKQQQKWKVEGLDKEIDRKILTFEDKRLVAKYTTHRNVDEQVDSLVDKEQLEICRQKIETERERYTSSVEETKRVTMNRLGMGFSLVFGSLAEFSRASATIYVDLVTLP